MVLMLVLTTTQLLGISSQVHVPWSIKYLDYSSTTVTIHEGSRQTCDLQASRLRGFEAWDSWTETETGNRLELSGVESRVSSLTSEEPQRKRREREREREIRSAIWGLPISLVG